ncbi:hypothetical protein BJ322DRAFT_1023854 [Thelephora terrestris]|uniref:Uncharacterized protein n=1 Tax=Thelephora terrestris TaxID=56493 RepID=A0A9P6H6N6_9AGAM|nr:hypothetical protein BJ322DRAFT_1023854 [Thelephora terrestris]
MQSGTLGALGAVEKGVGTGRQNELSTDGTQPLSSLTYADSSGLVRGVSVKQGIACAMGLRSSQGEVRGRSMSEDCDNGYWWLKVSEAPQRIEGSDREEEGIKGGNPQTSAHAGYVRTCSDSENTTARSPPHLIIPFAQERPKAPHTLNCSAMIDALVGEDPAYGRAPPPMSPIPQLSNTQIPSHMIDASAEDGPVYEAELHSFWGCFFHQTLVPGGVQTRGFTQFVTQTSAGEGEEIEGRSVPKRVTPLEMEHLSNIPRRRNQKVE